MFFLSQVTEADTPYETMLAGTVVMACGMGMAMSPATNSIMGAVPVSKAGVGSATNDTTREIGGALGVAAGHGVERRLPQPGNGAADQLDPQAYGFVSSSIQGANEVARQIAAQGGDAIAGVIRDVAGTAFASGMSDSMLIASLVMLGRRCSRWRCCPVTFAAWSQSAKTRTSSGVHPWASQRQRRAISALPSVMRASLVDSPVFSGFSGGRSRTAAYVRVWLVSRYPRSGSHRGPFRTFHSRPEFSISARCPAMRARV